MLLTKGDHQPGDSLLYCQPRQSPLWRSLYATTAIKIVPSRGNLLPARHCETTSTAERSSHQSFHQGRHQRTVVTSPRSVVGHQKPHGLLHHSCRFQIPTHQRELPRGRLHITAASARIIIGLATAPTMQMLCSDDQVRRTSAVIVSAERSRTQQLRSWGCTLPCVPGDASSPSSPVCLLIYILYFIFNLRIWIMFSCCVM